MLIDILYVDKIIIFLLYVILITFSFVLNNLVILKIKSKLFYFIFILLISILYSLFSLMVSCENECMMDRSRYLNKFLTNSRVATDGYLLLTDYLRIFSSNVNYFYFFVYFIPLLVTNFSLFIYPNINRYSFPFIILSGLFINYLYLFKQSQAIALIAVAFLIYTHKNGFLYKSLSIFLVMIASLFHETAMIFIPIFLLFLFIHNKLFRYLLYIVMFIFYIKLDFFISFFFSFIPILEVAFSHYQNDNASDSGFLQVFKYFGFVLLFFYCEKNKAFLISRIPEFYVYKISLLFIMYFALLTPFYYWFSRFSFYFYVPVLLFTANIMYLSRKSIFYNYYNLITILLIFLFPLRYFYITFSKGGF